MKQVIYNRCRKEADDLLSNKFMCDISEDEFYVIVKWIVSHISSMSDEDLLYDLKSVFSECEALTDLLAICNDRYLCTIVSNIDNIFWKVVEELQP